MCKLQMLRALVDQRLTAAVEKIFVVFERTIAEYEAELCRTKEENYRLLDAVFKKHQVVLRRTDLTEEHHLHEQEEEPQPLHIKEEEEISHLQHIKEEAEDPHSPHIKDGAAEHSISQEGDHIEGLVEIPVTGVPVKSEDDEVKGESEEKREAEPPSSSSTQHMTTEADGDHCGGSQADKLLAPLSDSEDTTSHSPDTDDEDSKDDKTCHTDNTHLKCSHCDKTFKYHCHLKRHMRIHTREKPFPCSICGLSFTRKNNMKEHTRTHKGEKPFSCSVCDSSVLRGENLQTHMRTHTGEKPFLVQSVAYLLQGRKI
ncbi:zinc finger and SCAN domain-containing protein 2-like [Entelurus aequoreus]|uniref:zinc finger and SCAN domain-containing protein 2-like n=1 Tax=Entelurus aequoreus TaxID=161455 RepID=UPI002B1D0C17|nr:zinc finger and SCAN domain-containing protein 2-like [Entelurus aequoreus]